jgi:hypothetical protein
MKVSKKSQSELFTRLKDGRSLWRKKREEEEPFLRNWKGMPFLRGRSNFA